MPAPLKLPPDGLRAWATQAIADHGDDFTLALAQHFGVSRMAAVGAVRRLEQEGFVQRVRGGTRPLFAPGPSRLLTATAPLPGLDESLLWSQHFSAWLAVLPPVLLNIAHYGFTEMVNNANDHSGGHRLTLRCALTPEALHLWVADDGLGVFERVRAALDLADLRLALLELCKGKVTTDPQRHTGEGLFFTSRAFSRFELRANGLLYRRTLDIAGHTEIERLESLDNPAAVGTQVFMSLRLDAPHSLTQIFDHYTTGAPDDLSFDRTVVPVKLAQLGSEFLVSRSQARRLTSRIDGFRRVELDFDGVDEIGQAFADELFRVLAAERPAVTLVPLNANTRVQAMIRRVRPG